MNEYSFTITSVVDLIGIDAESLEEAKNLVQAMINEGDLDYKCTDIMINELELVEGV